MSTVIARGLIDAPEAIRTHTEPASIVDGAYPLPTFTSQQVKDLGIGDFKNTGNVPQNLAITLSDFVNCNLISAWLTDAQGNEVDLETTLSPNEKATLWVKVESVYAPPGDDLEVGFTWDDVWS